MTLTLPMLALAAVMAISGAGQEQPQPQPQPQQLRGDALLTNLFVRVVEAYRERKVEPVEEFTGDYKLASLGTETAAFTVEGGQYSVIGMCDESCSDADLRVETAAGEALGEDVLDDDAPVVRLDLQPGQYRFAVTMKKCAVETCLARVKVYRLGEVSNSAPGA